MIDQIDNYQRNAYGTTKWATDYAGRNPVEGVNGMIKQDGSFNPESCRVFGTAAHTLAALMAAVIHNLKQTRRFHGVPPGGRTLPQRARLMSENGRSVWEGEGVLLGGKRARRKFSDEINRGEREGLTSDERERLGELERENARLRMERELLKRAVAFWVRESNE